MCASFLISKKYLVKFGVNDFLWLYWLAAILIGIVTLSVYSALSKKALNTMLAVLMTLFLSVLSVNVLPRINQHLQGTLHKYSVYAKEKLSSDENIFVYGINNPSIVFYSGHKVVPLKGKNELNTLSDTSDRALIITRTKHVDIMEKLGFHVLERDKQYALLERE